MYTLPAVFSKKDIEIKSSLQYISSNIDTNEEYIEFLKIIFDDSPSGDINQFMLCLEESISIVFKDITHIDIDHYYELLDILEIDDDIPLSNKNINCHIFVLMMGLAIEPIENSGISLEFQIEIKQLLSSYSHLSTQEFYNKYCLFIPSLYETINNNFNEAMDSYINNGDIVPVNPDDLLDAITNIFIKPENKDI